MYTRTAAEFSSMKNVKPMTMSWATSWASTSVRRHHARVCTPGRRHGAAALADVRLVLVAERRNGREHRCRLRIPESAQRLAHDVPCHRQQQVQIAHLPFAALDLAEQPMQP